MARARKAVVTATPAPVRSTQEVIDGRCTLDCHELYSDD